MRDSLDEILDLTNRGVTSEGWFLLGLLMFLMRIGTVAEKDEYDYKHLLALVSLLPLLFRSSYYTA